MYRIDGKCTFKDCKPTLIDSRQTQSNFHAENNSGVMASMYSTPAYAGVAAFC